MPKIAVELKGSWEALLKSGLFHLIFGPPVGGLICIPFAPLLNGQQIDKPFFANSIDDILFGLLTIIILSYIIGGVMAFLYGLVVGYLYTKNNRCSVLETLVAVVVVQIPYLVIIRLLLGFNEKDMEATNALFLNGAVILFLCSLAAAFAMRYLFEINYKGVIVKQDTQHIKNQTQGLLRKIIIQHILYGPLIGLAIVMWPFLFLGLFNPPGIALLIFYAYLWGAPVGLLCGVILGIIAERKGRYSYTECILSAVTSSILIGFVIRSFNSSVQMGWVFIIFILLAITAAVAIRMTLSFPRIIPLNK